MKKQYYLKRSLKPLMISCVVLLFQPSFADTASKEMLSELSEEASNTKMVNKQSENKEKETVDPTSTEKLDNAAAGEGLSQKIEDQLRRVLGKKKDSSTEGDVAEQDTEKELEKIVSSSLLEGAEMDDIRSAVSDAMTEIKNDKDKGKTSAIAPERITEAKKAFSKLTVTATKKTLSPTSVDNTVASASAFSETPTSHPETVTVQEGESLFKIALRVYGDGNKYYKLYKANEERITDPNFLLAGQVLVTPKF